MQAVPTGDGVAQDFQRPESYTMPTVSPDAVLYGPVGLAAYQRYAPEAPNNPNYAIDQIEKRFGATSADAAAKADRLALWVNYEQLERTLAASGTLPPLDVVFTFIKEVSSLAATELQAPRKNLGLHLQEISEFCEKFFLKDDGTARFPQLLNDRESTLLAHVIAPLHDVLKYLGSFKSQIMPDHQVLTAELVRQNFVGRPFQTKHSVEVFSAEDVNFVAEVIGDHENIEREIGRAEFIHSADSIQRAKALFFVADVLTGAIVEDQRVPGGWTIDESQLNTRFVDLYFRHIDPVRGKIFRPEWGAFAITDLVTTIGEMVEHHGLVISGSSPGERAVETLRHAAVSGIDRALDAETERAEQAHGGTLAEGTKRLTPHQIELVVAELKRLQALPL